MHAVLVWYGIFRGHLIVQSVLAFHCIFFSYQKTEYSYAYVDTKKLKVRIYVHYFFSFLLDWRVKIFNYKIFTQVHGRELESYGAKQSQDEQNNTEKLEQNRDEVLSYGVLSELNYEEILEDSDEVFHINIYK